MKEPYVFIFGNNESWGLISFKNRKPQEEKRLALLLGEIARKERNISFHGFRHFFNSTIRGTVSDDILRLQTGHLDEKMTDLYDHMTDDRGEQLRKAVQAKILPFIFHVPGLKPPPLGGQILAWLYARQYLKGKLSLFQHGTNYSRKRSDTE
jgi:hypothetical protein